MVGLAALEDPESLRGLRHLLPTTSLLGRRAFDERRVHVPKDVFRVTCIKALSLNFAGKLLKGLMRG